MTVLQAVPSSPESSSSYSSVSGRSRSRAPSRPPPTPPAPASGEESQFRAADVSQSIRRRVQSARRNKRPPLEVEDEELAPPQTTVAVDRPGLVVSGQRICILTGEDGPPVIRADDDDGRKGKVSLRVEFQRGCALRRSLSESRRRAADGPEGVSRIVIRPSVQFHDTTRLMVKSRSRGSIADLFDSESSPPPLPTSPPPNSGGTLR